MLNNRFKTIDACSAEESEEMDSYSTGDSETMDSCSTICFEAIDSSWALDLKETD
jgi:hypothetical protein